MSMLSIRLRASACGAGLALLVFSGWASADPPSRVARLGATVGAVSFSPAGEVDWVQATLNRPLTNGDRLWADADGRTEIQIGGAMVRMGANTGISVLNLDDNIAQLQLTEGVLNVRVLRLALNQAVEVDTPNLAFTLRKPGEYRISVDPDGSATDIVVRKGQGEAYGEGAAYLVDTRQAYRFGGTGLRNYQYLAASPPDDFDRWSNTRNRAYDQSVAARYVSPDVIGYQDLDANGTWRSDPNYGNVWTPNRVPAGWAPYREGHWAWVDPWGWTWIDDAPWGFAVSHYGRWAHVRDNWAWVPGPPRTQAWYAPAVVAFVGGSSLQVSAGGGNVGGVAWFPLAPREVYRPSYVASRAYVDNVNRSNTVVNTTVINNTYNTTNNTNNVTQVIYANRAVPGAVVTVPTTTFVQSQPVARAAIRATPVMLASAPVAATAAVAPTERSVHGPAGAGGRPPQRVFERPVVARSAPPAAHAGFAAQQQQLAARPGQPLDDAARQALKPAAAVAVAVAAVTVVAQAQAAPPTKAPPPPPQRAASAAPAPAPAPAPALVPASAPTAAPAPAAPPPRAAPSAPAAPMAPPRATPSAPANSAAPPQAVPAMPAAAARAGATPPAAPPPPIAAPGAAAPLSPPAAPASNAGPREPRGQKDQRGPADKRGERPAPAAGVPPQAATPTPSVPPAVAAPAPRAAPERAPEPRLAAPQAVAPAPAEQAPPPRPPAPKPPAPAPVAVPAAVAPAARPPAAPPAAPPAKPEPAPAARPAEHRPPPAAEKPAAPPPSPAAHVPPAPKAEPNGQPARPAAAKPREGEKEKSSEEKKREEDQGKPKG